MKLYHTTLLLTNNSLILLWQWHYNSQRIRNEFILFPNTSVLEWFTKASFAIFYQSSALAVAFAPHHFA